MDNSFSPLIDSANSILILLPTRPYLDQVAAGLALYLALAGNKEVSISCPTPMVVEFNRLVGVNRITSEPGNKNLTIKFNSYQAENIERVSADSNNGVFYLTVIPKPGRASPSKEQVEVNYSGVAADLVILIGGRSEAHFPALSQNSLVGVKTVHIGTKVLPVSSEKGLLSLVRPGSSVSEIVAEMIKENTFALNPDIATNLILGIEAGSNHFTGNDVTANTFEIFAYLMRSGGQRVSAAKINRSSFPQGSIPGEEFNLEKVEKKEAPRDWFEPKIYKGTSIS